MRKMGAVRQNLNVDATDVSWSHLESFLGDRF